MSLNFQDVIRDVHDPSNHRLNTSGGANATIFAVVNTGAAGIATVVVGNPTVYLGTPTINAVVNLPVSDPTVFIGTPTLYAVVNTGATSASNVTLNPSPNYIGLTTTTISNPTLYAVVNTSVAGDSVNNIGFATVAISNPTLYAVVNTGASNSNVTLNPSSAFIGLVTVANTVPVTWAGNVTVVDGGGSLTVDGSVGILGNITLSNPNTYIGLTTGTLGIGTRFIGLVTAYISSFPNLSFYQQASLVSGYKYYGNAAPGSNPTTAVFKIQRETLNTGEVLFGGGAPTFVHQWSSASLASLTYS